MKKIGVLLAGCGVYDGAEIQEAVLTLLAIEKNGAQSVCMAPDKPQLHVINHLTGEETDETRNVLVESARIARGNIAELSTVSAEDIDALILPGGFGAAKNLSRFAVDGPDGEVDPQVSRLVSTMFAAKKPIGLICISPAVGAQILGDKGIEITIGTDADTAAAVETCGAIHVPCSVTETHVDSGNKLVSTPAYMLGRNILEVSKGIESLVEQVIEWCK